MHSTAYTTAHSTHGAHSTAHTRFAYAITQHARAVIAHRQALRQPTGGESDVVFYGSHVLTWARIARTWLDSMRNAEARERAYLDAERSDFHAREPAR